MYRPTLYAIWVCLLCGCSTGDDSQPLVCLPPTDLRLQEGALPPLPESGVSLQQAMEQWMEDMDRFNRVRRRHAELVAWIEHHCLPTPE